MDDGGLYEQAFGIDGKLGDYWTEDNFNETLFAIISFVAILEKINGHIKLDKTKYYFLQRLIFWALSLTRVHIDKKAIKFEELLASKKKFDDWFSEFWRDIFRDLVEAFNAAQEAIEFCTCSKRDTLEDGKEHC